jgi:hypothetical protein
VELLEPPAGAAVGERVTVEGFSQQPDEQLNPKKKVRACSSQTAWQMRMDVVLKPACLFIYSNVVSHCRVSFACTAAV